MNLKIYLLFGFIILMLLIPASFFADTPEELEKKLASAPPAERAKKLNELAFAFREKAPAKTREYAEEALNVARRSSDKNEEAAALKNIGLSYFLVGEYEKTLEYYFQVLNIFKEMDQGRGVAVMKASIANVVWSMGDFENAMNYYHDALAYFRAAGETGNTASLLNNLGNVYLQWGKYPEALECYLQSLDIKKTLKDPNHSGEAYTLNNIGLAYRELDETAKALEFHQKALDLMRQIDSKKGISLCLNNIGLVYLKEGKPDRALEYFERSIGIKQEIDDNPGLSMVLTSIGDAYMERGESAKALDHYHRALAMREKLKDIAGVAAVYVDIGCIYRKLKDYERAIQYLEKAIPPAQQTQTRETLREAFDLLSRVYSEKGDTSAAWEYNARALMVKDEMFNKTANKRIRELQLKYETGRLKSGFAVQKKRLMLYIFTAAFLFIFAVTFLYFIVRSRRRIISKTDSLLQRKDMEIEYRVRQIHEINAELDSLKKKKKTKKYEGSRLTDKQSETYLVNLIRFMEHEKPYLDEDLTLKELADRTGIPLRDLSRIINEKLHKNFSDFINFYRVEEAKHLLLREGKLEMTILDIAYDVGFNSKSNFNSVFKRHTGITPSFYKKKKDGEARIASVG